MAAEDKINNFNVPEGYFDTLADKIRTEVFLEELKEKKLDCGFLVPDNYFENLKFKLYKKEQPLLKNSKKSAKILPFRFVKYAVAASFLIFCTLGIYVYITNNQLQNQLASLPNEDIEVYLQNNTTAGDMPMILENLDDIKIEVSNEISTKELNEYITETI